jgi:type I restriction enzyme S subunit
VISEAWPLRPLGQLFEIGAGKTMSAAGRDGEDKTPFLRTSNVLWDEIDLTTVDEMAIPKHELPAKLLRPGDLLVCEGGEIGRAAIWNGEAEVMSFQNHLHRLRPLGDDVDPRYYVYFLQSAFTQLGIFEGAANKTTIPNLSRNRLAALDVPHPRLDEQQAVVTALARVREASRLHDRSCALAQELKRAAMRELFTHGLRGEAEKETEIGPVPESWEFNRLGDIADIVYGAQAAVANATDPSIGTLILTNVNIDLEGHIDLAKRRYYKVPEAHRERLSLRKGDVLFNWRSGSASHIGKTVFFDLDGDFTYSSFILRFRPHKSVGNKFLFWWLTHLRVSGFFTAQRNVSSINSVYNASLSATIPIWAPDDEQQREIAGILDAIDHKIDLHRKKRAVFDELFKALLHKLMTGEIRVGDLDLSALAPLGSGDGLHAGSKRDGSTIAHTPSRVGNVAFYTSDSRQVAGEPSCP